MLLHASSSAEVPMNVRGALEAAHDAIQAFFLLSALFEAEAKVWWVFNHRAFLEAMCMANILRDHENAEVVAGARDPLFVRAKADVGEYLPDSLPAPPPLLEDACMNARSVNNS